MKGWRNLAWFATALSALGIGVVAVEAATAPHVAKATFTTREYAQPHAKGFKKSPGSAAFLNALPRRHLRRSAVIPKVTDLTPLVSPPENQGSCGSCWDFSLTKALRSAFMLAGKDPGTLAFNYLLNNCGPGPKMWGCNGGDFDAGNNFLGGAGPWLESQDPYSQSEGRCKTGLKVAGTAIAMHQVGNGSSGPTFQELADALSSRKMLSIDVAVVGSWGNYSNGIYNSCSGGPGSINHMINAVGYDCETSVDAAGNCTFDAAGRPSRGDGFLLVQNNWGSWGENGYMRTRLYDRSGGHCNAIATTAVYFEVDTPAPIDGGWTPWGECVGGKQARTCTNPSPANGGKVCEGPAEQACAVPVPPTPGGGLDWKLVALAVAAVLAVIFGVAFWLKK